ncbi:DUF1365 domain-containing protein [Oceanibium sediminis]|uniref:DUF1365 domain-containing protein n=1 Tax=Oceanibium sediminis TaxID=2026339 RepID=UPI0018E4FE86|nr:DUF1365 domain-containing protein [Oceanibium sediminis]
MSRRPPARLYLGHVMHMRLIPRRHRFRYRVFSLLIDIDRVDAVTKKLWLLSHNRFGVMSFMNKDHGPRDGSALRPWVDATLAQNGLPPAPRVELLSFPRMLGYGFNPLSVYYCFDAADRLAAIIYEVKNTYGDQIAYALPVENGPGPVEQQQQKQMYVSPFIGMDQTYRFTLAPPDKRLALRIRQAGPEGDVLIATHTGKGVPLGDGALLKAFVTHPLMTFRVIALIHWHALRLALKGVRFHSYTGPKGMRNLLSEKDKSTLGATASGH